MKCALTRCEWYIACLYMDTPGYIKHIYKTQPGIYARSSKTKTKSGLCTSHTALSQGICKFVAGAIQRIFERPQPRTESSNALKTLELHATLSTPDLGLGTHAYMHVSCVQKLFCLVQAKKLTVLCSCLRSSI